MTAPALPEPAPVSPLATLPGVTADPAGLEAAVRWAAEAPLRVRWTREQLAAGYCARSPGQLLSGGELPFTAPCADLSSLVALALEQAGLRPTLVLAGIRRAWQPVKFQCGLEVSLGGATWVVGFGVSSAYLYRGCFLETPRRPWVWRFEPSELDPDRSFLEWCLEGGREALAARLPGYDLARDVADHARRQTRWRYAWARWRAGSAARAARAGRVPGAGGRWA